MPRAQAETAWNLEVMGEYRWDVQEEKKIKAREAEIATQAQTVIETVDSWSRSAGFADPSGRTAKIWFPCRSTPGTLAFADPVDDSMNILVKSIESKGGDRPPMGMGGLSDAFGVHAIAHEFQHLIHYTQSKSLFYPGPVPGDFKWVTESTPEAFALFYATSLYTPEPVAMGTVYRRTEYDLPLHMPGLDDLSKSHLDLVQQYHDYLAAREGVCGEELGDFDPLAELESAGNAGNYRRGHFFYHLGHDLTPSQPERYLANASHKKLDPQNMGLSWVEQQITREGGDRWKGLFDYYPEFIARHADDPDRHYSKGSRKQPVSFTPPDETHRDSYEGSVLQVAADPREVILAFEAGSWPRKGAHGGIVKLENQVYLFVQEFDKALSDNDPRTLVVDHSVVQKTRPYKRAVWASPQAGTLELFNRVVNVSRKPWESSKRDYRIRQSLQRVRWRPPTCVLTGEPFAIPLQSGGDLATAADIAEQIHSGYAAWQVSGAARILDPEKGLFIFDAPGEAEFSFVLNYGGDPEIRHVIAVATIKSDGDDCRILGAFPGQPVRQAYTARGDFSEIKTDDGARIYVGVNRFAAYIPQDGGWVSIPPGAQAMMQAQFNQYYGSLPELPPWADRPDEGFMARLPWVFNKWWDYREITDRMEDDPAIASMASYACPGDTGNCRRIRVSGGVIEYDAFNRLSRLDAGGQPMTLEYGDISIGRPPGWSDRPNPEVFGKTTPAGTASAGASGSGGAGGGQQDGSAAAKAQDAGSRVPGGAQGGHVGTGCDCSCEAMMSGSMTQACAMTCGAALARCFGR